MILNSSVDIIVDLISKKQFFLSLQKVDLLKYFIDNYSHIVAEEIFHINIDLIENQKNSKNDSLLLSKILFETQQILQNDFKIFLNECSLDENDSEFLYLALNNDQQDKSIISLMRQLIKNQSFSILKEYRESPQARKDIKKNINNQNISSSILNPFLMLLNDTNAPSLRMELWQKFEMYFESGWGFNDLTVNDSNSPLATKMQSLIKQINEKEEKLNTHSGLGNELLTIISERISELGVPIQITMEKNIVNGANIPVAKIIEEKTKYKHSFLSKSTMGSGFVDWAIPNFHDKEKLHCSLATSDETCSVENSEAFRYEYALRNLCKEKHNIFKTIELSFYSTSTFYDEYDSDNLFNSGKNKEIGQEFLKRYKVHKEQRKLLNIIPFFAMSHKISSNLKTGIYSPNQLMSYDFKILGAKSMLENKNYEIEEIYKRCISVILKVFSQDDSADYYADSKSLNMLNQLYNLLTTSKDEFFESKKIFNLLTNPETISSLNSIFKKIPENQNNEKQVNKNDFKTLIQSLKYISTIGFHSFKEEQIENRHEFLKELERIKKLTTLSSSLLYINKIDNEIDSLTNKTSSMQEIDDFLLLKPQEQKLFIQKLLIDVYSRCSDGRTNHQMIFYKNKTIDNYYYNNYPLSSPTYYNHRKLFDNFNKNKSSFLSNWKNGTINHYDNLLKMCYFYVNDINTSNFHQFKLPSSLSYDDTAKKINSYVDLLNPLYIQKIKLEHQNNLIKIEELKEGKSEIINTLNNTYPKEDINFILEKMDIGQSIKQEFFKDSINVII